MGIIARKYNSQNMRYNQIKGSGIYPRGSICMLDKCLPKPNSTPTRPIPKEINRGASEPLIATKTAGSNQWSFLGTLYPDFNSLWVNIPKGSFVIFKTNG